MRYRTHGVARVVCAVVLSLQVAPVWAAGVARVLTDEELDQTYAGGSVVVRVSFSLPRIADRFDFNFASETTIRVPPGPGGADARATVDFLGGLISVGAGSDSSGPASGASNSAVAPGNGPLSWSVQAAGSTDPAGPAGGVSVRLGNTSGLGNSLIGISARDIAVDTRVQMMVGANPRAQAALQSALRSTLQRQIRGALGAAP